MQAIILAGGFGTRLKSLVSEVPKPMAPVAGRPFLCWLLEYMAGQGVTQAVLCVHHLSGTIQSYFGHRYAGIELLYSIEPEPLGTGGAIRQAMELLNPVKPVFVLNGDSLVQLDYASMMAQHHYMGRAMTLASCNVPDCSRYSELHIKSGLIQAYDVLGAKRPGNISVGFYVLSPDIFIWHSVPRAFSFERDFLRVKTSVLQPAIYNGVEYFIDIGVPHDYARANAEVPIVLERRKVA